MRELGSCGDCGAKIGVLHDAGCDMETCPRCGGQAISCNCIYEVNGMDQSTLEKTHPRIYTDGPTSKMYEKWDKEWEARRIPWAGEPHAAVACRQFGWYSKWIADSGWVTCEATDPEAREDLNRLFGGSAQWNSTTQTWERSEGGR